MAEKDKKRLRRWIKCFVKNDNSDTLNTEEGSKSETDAQLSAVREQTKSA